MWYGCTVNTTQIFCLVPIELIHTFTYINTIITNLYSIVDGITIYPTLHRSDIPYKYSSVVLTYALIDCIIG